MALEDSRRRFLDAPRELVVSDLDLRSESGIAYIVSISTTLHIRHIHLDSLHILHSRHKDSRDNVLIGHKRPPLVVQMNFSWSKRPFLVVHSKFRWVKTVF